MARKKAQLSIEQQLRILQFWAQGMEILASFDPVSLNSVDGLQEAIEAVRNLPAEIGWEDEPTMKPPSNQNIASKKTRNGSR